MKIFRFDPEVGRRIDQFGSVHAVLSRIVRLTAGAQVSCMCLSPDGVVGYHQAAMPQLFLVVQGEGWVRGEAPERVPVRPGLAAFWDRGEWHETATTTGLTAIVIESEALGPAEFMPVG
jgi:quercetin dioxygenase-like cupin family protein